MQARRAKPRISQEDARWFRDRHSKALDEIRELRYAVEQFARDLETGSLTGRLLAAELRGRIKNVRAR